MEKVTLSIEVSPESAFVLQEVAKNVQGSLGEVVEAFMVLGKALGTKQKRDRVSETC